jgi:hypothetical protein
VTYIYAFIAVWHYRAPTPAETTRYRCVAALAIAGCVWIIAMSSVTMLWLAAAFAVVVTVFYFIVARPRANAVAS